jgi:ParB-like chromosome segregation protein Spo0J
MSKQIKSLGGSTTSAYKIDPEKILIAGYDYTPPNDDSNLVEIDKARLGIDKSMVKSIAAVGVVQPVQCRIVDGYIVVINGRRRVLHARAANEIRAEKGEEPFEVTFTLERGSDSPDALVTMVTANTFAESYNPMVQAQHAQQMLDRGLSRDDVAAAFGFSNASLINRLKLLDLPSKIQKHVAAGQLSLMAALEFHGVEDTAAAVEAANALVAEGGGTGKGSRKRASADAPEKVTRPTLGLLRKLLETEEFSECSEDVQRTIRWVTGDLKTPNTIDGLASAVKAASGKKKAPPKVEEAAE